MRSRRHPLHLTTACALAILVGVAAVAHAEGYESDASVIQVVSTKIGEKNVFIPATIVVVGGREHTLSLFNTTDTPHGFAIDGLGIEEVLPVGIEHPVKIPAVEGGKIFAIRCHLHPPHRTATLVVVPASDAASPGSGGLVD